MDIDSKIVDFCTRTGIPEIDVRAALNVPPRISRPEIWDFLHEADIRPDYAFRFRPASGIPEPAVHNPFTMALKFDTCLFSPRGFDCRHPVLAIKRQHKWCLWHIAVSTRTYCRVIKELLIRRKKIPGFARGALGILFDKVDSAKNLLYMLFTNGFQFPAIKFVIDSMQPDVRENAIRSIVGHGRMIDLEVFDYCRELYPDLELPDRCRLSVFMYRHNTTMLQYYHLRNELPEIDMHYFVQLVHKTKFKYIKKYIELFNFDFLTYDENIYAIINMPSRALRYILNAGVFRDLMYSEVMDEIYAHVKEFTPERVHKIGILMNYFMTRGS